MPHMELDLFGMHEQDYCETLSFQEKEDKTAVSSIVEEHLKLDFIKGPVYVCNEKSIKILNVNFHSKCNTPVALTMTECCSNYDKRKE